MRIAMGTDHGGYVLKEYIKAHIVAAGHEVLDFGSNSEDSVDFPDFVVPAARAVAAGEADRGIVLCGSGAGASITAGKVRGVRAAIIHDVYTAHQGVEHDGMNVIALGGRVIGPEPAWEIVQAFLGAEFSGEERHLRRVAKIDALEETDA